MYMGNPLAASRLIGLQEILREEPERDTLILSGA